MASHPSIAKHPDLDEWIEIAADGRIVLHTGKVELGQRIYTALAIIAAEELDVDYDRIDVRRAETGVDPNEGMTTGSMSMQHSGNAIRMASATARRHLLALAAKRLGVEADSLEVADGLVQSRDSNQSVSYWDLMEGKAFGIPVDETVRVKAPQDHTRVGRRVTPKGMAEIVTGRMTYLPDMTMPGMLHARLVRPPHYFARLQRLDDTVVERLSAEDVTVVRDGSFIAVAAENEYAAVKAAGRLRNAAEWDEGDGLPTGELFESITGNERVSLPVAAGGAPVEEPVPELVPPPEEAAVTLSARYEKPYLMHGSMGPSAGCALYESGKLTVWTHSQGIYALRGALARALDMDEADLHLVFMPAAGCYGHNGADDAAFEAALIALAIPGTPVLLKWTRDDEHAWEPYGSAMVCALRGSLDSEGRIVDWSHESYGDTFIGRPVPGRYDSPESRLVSTHFREAALDWPVPAPAMGAHIGIHRNLEPLYAIPNPRLVKNLVRGLPLRTSALRSLGAFGNVAAIESFMDELADAAGIDPVDFRLRHLEDERAGDVVRTLAERMAADGGGRRPRRRDRLCPLQERRRLLRRRHRTRGHRRCNRQAASRLDRGRRRRGRRPGRPHGPARGRADSGRQLDALRTGDLERGRHHQPELGDLSGHPLRQHSDGRDRAHGTPRRALPRCRRDRRRADGRRHCQRHLPGDRPAPQKNAVRCRRHPQGRDALGLDRAGKHGLSRGICQRVAACVLISAIRWHADCASWLGNVRFRAS